MTDRFKRHSHPVTIWNARLSFPEIFEPKPIVINGQQVGDPRYSCRVIVTDPAKIAEVQRIEEELIRQSWPQGVPPGINIRRALQRGETAYPRDPQMAGLWILSANARPQSPPQVVSIHRDAQGNFPPLTDRQHIYSGCEANVHVGIYTTQLNVQAPQIDCGLNSVQPTERAMDRFDGRVSATQAFADNPNPNAGAGGPGFDPNAPAPGYVPPIQPGAQPQNPWGGPPAAGQPDENQWGQSPGGYVLPGGDNRGGQQ